MPINIELSKWFSILVVNKAAMQFLKAKYFQINLTNSKKVNELIKSERPQIINHHAASISLTKSIKNPMFDANNNISSIINLLEAAKKYSVKKIIFASSGGALYSSDSQDPYTEQDVLSPISPYGVSKLSSEHYIKVYSYLYGLDYVIFRYSNVYGPRQNVLLKPVISVFIEKLLSNKNPTIFNNGMQTRDFIYVEDLKEANILALDYKKNEIFNICLQKETQINELFNIIQKMIKSDIKPIFKIKKVKEQNQSLLSYKKAKSKLKWKPKYSLKKGLEETITWHENK